MILFIGANYSDATDQLHRNNDGSEGESLTVGDC